MMLEEYKQCNDSVRQFADEILPQAQWDLLPYTFLYDMYKEWFKRNIPSGKLQSKTTFIQDLIAALPPDGEWLYEGRDKNGKHKQYRIKNYMVNYEPLIGVYNLTDWMNPTYAHKGTVDMAYKCTPAQEQFKDKYRGLIRKNALKASANGNSDTDDEEDT